MPQCDTYGVVPVPGVHDVPDATQPRLPAYIISIQQDSSPMVRRQSLCRGGFGRYSKRAQAGRLPMACALMQGWTLMS